MRAKREYRNREGTEGGTRRAGRSHRGRMTVFELRAAVEVDIDELEDALSTLKADDLIVVESGSETIKPAEWWSPTGDEDDDQSIGEWLRERLPLNRNA